MTLYSVRDIAGWSIALDHDSKAQVGSVKPPKFQRSAVWRPYQIELLWDSILREFPIGSFLIAQSDEERGEKALAYSDKETHEGSVLHLLDGQQRANAIALGFLDLWKAPTEMGQPRDALWIDLEQEQNDGREYIFRVVTRSHPWGYKRINPRERLSVRQYTDAMREFKKGAVALPYFEMIEWKPGKIPLQVTWPFDLLFPLDCFSTRLRNPIRSPSITHRFGSVFSSYCTIKSVLWLLQNM